MCTEHEIPTRSLVSKRDLFIVWSLRRADEKYILDHRYAYLLVVSRTFQ